MKAPFSPYLNGIVPWVHQLVDLLGKTYDYVSVLSTDSVGFTIQMSQRSKSVTNSNMTTERGNSAESFPFDNSKLRIERKLSSPNVLAQNIRILALKKSRLTNIATSKHMKIQATINFEEKVPDRTASTA